jgi:gliding motility-associated-like protein
VVKKILVFFFLLVIGFNGFAQLSKVHYIPPLTSGPSNADPLDQWFYISTPINGDVSFKIKPVGGTADEEISYIVNNANPKKIQIATDGYSQLFQDPATTSTVTNNKGYIIESQDVIYVSIRMNAGGNAQAGALVSKGENAPGKIFRIGTYDNKGNPGNNYMNFFSVMATEDQTTVNLSSNNIAGLVIQNYSGQFPIENIILNRGESYTVALKVPDSNANRDGLIGALVSSDKPVVVNSGSANGSFGNGGARDYGIDQIVGLDKVGREYIFVKGEGDDSYENVLIVAHYDNTDIKINEESTEATINKGDYFIIEGDKFTDGNMFVSSSQDVFAYQGIGGASEANQGMFFVPPLSCESRGDVNNIAFIDEIGDNTLTGGITIVTKGTATVLINNTDIGSQPGGVTVNGPSTVTGKNEYVTYKVTGLSENVSVSSSDELYAAYYNQNGTATSGSFYAGFPSNPNVSLNLVASALGSCISSEGVSNVTFEVSNSGSYDTLQWIKKNPGTETYTDIDGETNTTYKPTEIGTYAVKGTITCTGTMYKSSDIPISVCPTDYDDDGIVDNLDLDNDNDGILNSVESLGNGILNINDLLSPTFSLKNGKTNTVTLSGELSKVSTLDPVTNTFTGTATGIFKSDVTAAESGTNTYTISATSQASQGQEELLFFHATKDPNVVHDRIDGESFIWRVLPENKNITVWDPDDRLLIDTNFDGAYETGVTSFTSSEIHFKTNPNPSGESPYEFFASDCKSITFIHRNINKDATSSYSGFIETIDYSLNTDSDSTFLYDFYDLDSDNDTCNDLTEAGFEKLDPDGDGILGTGLPTFDNNKIDERGKYKDHTYPDPLKDNAEEKYLFQKSGTAISITNQPSTANECESSNASFEVTTGNPNPAESIVTYKWQFYDVDNTIWNDVIDDATYSGATTNKLEILSINQGMNGNKFRVNVSTNEFLCGIDSNEAVLNVIATPSKPIIDPIQIYCFDESNQAKVSDLTINDADASLTIGWYEEETGGDALDSSTLLVHEKKYYAQVTNSNGCISTSRTETKAFISNPTLSSTKQAVCLSESTTISVTGVPQTAQDFIKDHPELDLFLTYEGSNYFLKQEAMAWEDAYDLIQSYGSGASMYQINKKEEENAVYDKLAELGFANAGSSPNNHFWLGLKQYNTEELNPDNKTDKGWYWLDGRPLTDELANWSSSEPNDCCITNNVEDGEENYGQFDFGGVAKKWNDMTNVQESGNSWPVFEFNGTTSVVWGKYTNDDKTEFETFDETSSSLTVTPTKTTVYFLEVTINGVLCRTEYTVTVNPNPISNSVNDLIFCDDKSDEDDTNGFIQTINLESLNPSILGESQSLDDFTVSYHLTKEDADDITKSGLISPYTNSTKDGEKIFIRVLNNTTQCINTENSFDIKINNLPVANTVNTIIKCDDNSVGDDKDGIISSFNLASQTATILGNQSAQDFTVTYHISQADADDISSNGLSSPYTNTTAGGEKIYIRVLNNNLGCFRASTNFNIEVAPLPIIINPLIKIEQCDDDDDNDGVSIHNLIESQLIISSDYKNETFEYYTAADFNVDSLIADPTKFQNDPFNDSVYVKIITTNNCYRSSQIDITVAASQISKTFMEDNNTFYALCEDSPALNQDGIATFSSDVLKEVKQKLIASNAKFSAQNIRVSLHTKSEDALSGENPVDVESDFTNTTPTSQPIWASIENTELSSVECLGLKQVATLYVEPRPVANAVSIAKQCDGDNSLDLDSQDGKFPFDTSSIQSTLVGAQTNVTTYYYLPNGTLIGNELPNPFLSTSQTIDIRIELASALGGVNNPNGLCYDTTSLEFVVNDSPEAYPVTIAANCDDGSDDSDGFSEFDTSTVLTTLLTNPSTGVTQSLSKYNVSFNYKDDKGVNQTTDTLPNPFNTKTQTVIATVINPLNTECVVTKNIEFVVNPLPLFERADNTSIVCLNLDPIPIGVKSSDSRTYTYSWTRNGTAFPANVSGTDSSILIGLGGEYEVIATTTDGTNCTRSLKITIVESKIATVVRKDIVVKDLTKENNNTITILRETLGIGDYEYAIDDISGPYQDEALFEKVRPGIHTIYIRDKNNCGIAKIDVSVIGYKKFFTPNSDGYHDKWKILGIRADFQPKTKVYIFDRYGKLIKELDPLNDGWDGNYNGKPMPQSDYWFRVNLEDGREFKAHFSLIRAW